VPECSPWSDIAYHWDQTVMCTSQAEDGLTEYDMQIHFGLLGAKLLLMMRT
jgi:hypothetical protein